MKTDRPKKYPKTIRAGSVRVRIYQNKSKRYKSGFVYQIAWHDGNSRRLKQFGDSEDADLFARQTASDLQSGRDASGLSREDMDELSSLRSMAGDTPPIEAMREWARCRDLTKNNLLAASKQWSKANSASFRKILLTDAITEFRSAKIAQGVDFKSSYKNRLDLLNEAFPGQPITAITTKDLNRFLAGFENPVTRNTHRRCIVTLFTWSRKQGYLPDSTRTAADNTDRALERDDSKVGIITPSTAEDLLRLIYGDQRLYLAPLVLALFTGLRRCEIHSQIWEDIDLASGRLHVSKAKPRTPADRLVEIPAAALDWLMLCDKRSGPVCPNLAIDRIRDIAKTAEIELPENCFRHSAITFMMATGKSAGETASWAGTSERQIHRHYRRPRPKSEGELWFTLSPRCVLKNRDNIIELNA